MPVDNRGFRSVLQTDLYQLTMAAAYHQDGHNPRATFELFVRKLPSDRAFLIFAGLEEAVSALLSLSFAPDEMAYLKDSPAFEGIDDSFFERLASLRFTGDVWAVAEGTVVFPGMPLVRVTAPLIEAQLVETYLLSVINYSTMVATKAARIVEAAQGRKLLEFGTRRAHGPLSGVMAARSAYIAGFAGTSNVEAGMRYGVPISGTSAHSFIMSYDREEEAFAAYQSAFPQATTLLVDTYDTLEGVRRAARMTPPPQGIRLDSGDLGALAKQARLILDEHGCQDTRIVASNDLNEYRIAALLADGAPIDAFGVGTELSTVRDAPAISGVYKLVERERPDGSWYYVAKNSPGKPSYPGRKQVYRIFDKDGMACQDIVSLPEETPPANGEPLLSWVIEQGEQRIDTPSLADIRRHCEVSLGQFSDVYKVLRDAPTYPVVYSEPLESARLQAIDAQEKASVAAEEPS